MFNFKILFNVLYCNFNMLSLPKSDVPGPLDETVFFFLNWSIERKINVVVSCSTTRI